MLQTRDIGIKRIQQKRPPRRRPVIQPVKLSDVHSECTADLEERIADLDLVVSGNDRACDQYYDEARNEDDYVISQLGARKALQIPVLGSDRKDQRDEDAQNRQPAEYSGPEER